MFSLMLVVLASCGSDGDCVYYKEVTNPFGGDGEEEIGYGFIRVVQKSEKTNCQLESGGDIMDSPLAKSFDPKS